MSAVLQFSPIKGAPPTIEWLSTDALRIDESYQRSIAGRDSQAIIRTIAAGWDWRLCTPLAVSRRRPLADEHVASHFVIDGQHRLEAAKLRGDIMHLPCIVNSFADAAEEASLFVDVNMRRRRVTPLDTFRAAMIAGDALALEAAALIDGAGLSLPRVSSPSGWAPNELGQVGTVMKGLRRNGRDITAAALAHVAEAFPDEKLEQAGRILDGLFMIYADPPAGFDSDRLFQTLLRFDQQQWAALAMNRIAATSDGWPMAMRMVIVDAMANEPALQEAAA
ncbi:hypothetical protein GGR88_001373 [Sphingomonas jejuensis]|uniref:ParB/Sulfiredoxin domain-containing protein n=1 Tax=Sphingomonas jejuensis TaxID=904715 RepID=A0ABX0XKM6_9SPHN|nr:DUF6551 family protein [Sphingomonas jejuensis]NJC33899.1 hypothetical protein [Sphingomonas jejuensis]